MFAELAVIKAVVDELGSLLLIGRSFGQLQRARGGRRLGESRVLLRGCIRGQSYAASEGDRDSNESHALRYVTAPALVS